MTDVIPVAATADWRQHKWTTTRGRDGVEERDEENVCVDGENSFGLKWKEKAGGLM